MAEDTATINRPADAEGRTPMSQAARMKDIRQAVREAAALYQFKGLKMVVTDDDGEVVEKDPAEVIAALDAADQRERDA